MTPEKIALKRAFGDVIKGVGGLDEAARLCRIGKSSLAEQTSVHHAERFPALDVLADLEPLARERSGWPHVLREYARQLGFHVTPIDAADAPERMTPAAHLAAISREAGDVFAELADAVAGAAMSTRDRADVVRALDELVDSAMAARVSFLDRPEWPVDGQCDKGAA